MMQRIASNSQRYCQNKQCGAQGWLSVDHIFVSERAWDVYPEIAIEHENRGMGDLSIDTLRGPTLSTKTPIGWALWKVLSVRCELPILVAYPWEDDRERLLDVLKSMAKGWTAQYRVPLRTLLLLGWWSKGNRPADPDNLYEALTLNSTPDGDFQTHDETWNAPQVRPLASH
jgi:hypothetical protein